MAKDETASQRAVQGASLLILLQVISRAITFIANQLLLRFLTAQLLGVSTQLEVYYLSVIFFARESLRVAVQRQDSPSSSTKKDGKHDEAKATQAVVNLGYLAIASGIPLAGGFGWLYLHSFSAETLASTPYLVTSLYIYALAAVIELISEPAFVVMQARLQFSTRATAESVATFLRCIVTLGSAIWGATIMTGAPNGNDSLRLGVLPFALGQLSYGLGLLVVYTFYGSGLAKREGFSLLPRRITSSSTQEEGAAVTEFALSYFYRPTVQLASSMIAQSIVKHVLTQGDTLLVSILSTPTAQGVYALANNYGGLVARLVFQPIEESSRSYFSKLLATSSSEPSSPSKTSNDNAKQALDSLTSLLKIYTLFSSIILPIAPHAAPLLLTIVAGKQWSTPVAASTLSLYTIYIPLLAINGITEAFVSSVATKSQVHTQSAWMTFFSLIFAGAGFIFLRVLDMGARGLVFANGINMLGRIIWSGLFISRYFADKERETAKGAGKKEGDKEKGEKLEFDVLGLLPKLWVVLVAVVTSDMVRRVPAFLAQLSFLGRYVGDMSGPVVGAKPAMVQLVGMAVASLPFVVFLLFSERHFLLQGYRSLAKR